MSHELSIANQLATARTSQRVRLIDVANFCGLSRRDVWEFERGIKTPSPEELKKLSECFGVEFVTSGQDAIDVINVFICFRGNGDN